MDHMLSRPNICGATNKDSITMSRCTAFWEMAKFNSSSWAIAIFIGGLAYALVAKDYGNWLVDDLPENYIEHAMFSGPAIFLAIICFVSPIILNPYVLGWPFYRRPRAPKNDNKANQHNQSSLRLEGSGKVLGLGAFMDASKALDNEIGRIQKKPDLELGTVRDLYSIDGSSPQLYRPKMVGRQSSADAGKNQMHRIPDAYRASKPHGNDHDVKASRKSSSKHEHVPSSHKRVSKFDI